MISVTLPLEIPAPEQLLLLLTKRDCGVRATPGPADLAGGFCSHGFAVNRASFSSIEH